MRGDSSKHAGFQGEVDALQTHGVEESGRIADDQSSVEVILRDSPVPAFGNRLRAVGVKGTALEDRSDVWVRFEFLKTLMRIEPRVEVIQTNNKTDRDAAFGHVVDEPAAELFIAQWPADGVNHTPAGFLF